MKQYDRDVPSIWMVMKENVADEIQCLTCGMRAGSAVVMAAFFS